ncbi:hypothetical protein [Chitinophaga sp. MM2321]|uniref:hypothetical protein n=1 Tax=Chitinophaga sp. MM2321 TaxID=3137178 RepID=UPI0032D5753E
MRTFIPGKLLILLVAVNLFAGACKKKDATTPEKSEKYELVTGDWKQADIVFAVPVKLGPQEIPAGTSIIALAPLLGPAGELFLCTQTNIYKFNTDGSFAIDGCTDLILPTAGNTGTWKLDVHDAVFLLTSAAGENDPHWIETVNATDMSLSITVTVPGVATIPLILQLQKQ